jgi:hypothetical protein
LVLNIILLQFFSKWPKNGQGGAVEEVKVFLYQEPSLLFEKNIGKGAEFLSQAKKKKILSARGKCVKKGKHFCLNLSHSSVLLHRLSGQSLHADLISLRPQDIRP